MLLGPKNELANVVVSLTPTQNPPLNWQDPSHDYLIKIRNCTFEPRVLIVPPRSKIRIRSEDSALFHLRTMTKKNKRWARALPQNLTEASFSVSEPEIVSLLCDLHPWMRAYIIVSSNPLHAITTTNGVASFESVPAGEYRAFLWHEIMGAKEIPSIIISPQRKMAEFVWKLNEASLQNPIKSSIVQKPKGR